MKEVSNSRSSTPLIYFSLSSLTNYYRTIDLLILIVSRVRPVSMVRPAFVPFLKAAAIPSVQPTALGLTLVSSLRHGGGCALLGLRKKGCHWDSVLELHVTRPISFLSNYYTLSVNYNLSREMTTPDGPDFCSLGRRKKASLRVVTGPTVLPPPGGTKGLIFARSSSFWFLLSVVFPASLRIKRGTVVYFSKSHSYSFMVHHI